MHIFDIEINMYIYIHILWVKSTSVILKLPEHHRCCGLNIDPSCGTRRSSAAACRSPGAAMGVST